MLMVAMVVHSPGSHLGCLLPLSFTIVTMSNGEHGPSYQKAVVIGVRWDLDTMLSRE